MLYYPAERERNCYKFDFFAKLFLSNMFLLGTLSIQVSSYTNIFGTVQMMEAFCLGMGLKIYEI